METIVKKEPYSPMRGIHEQTAHGMVVLSPAAGKPRRRILFINSYGGRSGWEDIKKGSAAPHHLWGMLELVRMGYEVAIAEPLAHFNGHRRSFPHDLPLLKAARSWLGPEDLIFCAHTLLYYLPFLKSLGALNRRMISLTYAREDLDFAKVHGGIAALTPAAADQARKMAPGVKVGHVGWGVDPDFYPMLPYDPQFIFSCGIANRDFATQSQAAALSRAPFRIICPGDQPGLTWPAHADVRDGGTGWHTDGKKKFSLQDLIRDNYAQAAASLVIIKPDPEALTANGFTNMLEGMALGRPLIVSRTGAMPAELDVEKLGCGLFVPPGDPDALAEAMDWIMQHPDKAREMGEAGRRLCEQHYHLSAFALRLHDLFESR
ncbi:MAG: glycosyltransferase [Verrucomicrobiota bacterium]